MKREGGRRGGRKGGRKGGNNDEGSKEGIHINRSTHPWSNPTCRGFHPGASRGRHGGH